MSDLNEIKTILALLKAYDAAVKEEIFENLVLSGQLKGVIDSSENKPKYSLNLLDVFNVAEPLISKIISLIFKYKRGHDYVLCQSFVEEFLVDCGFDLEWIKRPSMIASSLWCCRITSMIHFLTTSINPYGVFLRIGKVLIKSVGAPIRTTSVVYAISEEKT